MPNFFAGLHFAKISASCLKSEPTEFFCPAVFSSKIITSAFVFATSFNALVSLLIPFSSPEPL